jgi:acyl carrier protein
MTTQTLEDRIKHILIEEIGVSVPKDEITDNADLREDLGLDSLDIVELTMDIEDMILDDAEVDDEISDEWKTFGDVVNSVSKIAEKGV